MPQSVAFPSFFDPTKSWVITDVWDPDKPFTDRFIPEPDTGQDHRWTTQIGFPHPEEIYPIYRIQENGIDIGWVVFTWIRLNEKPPLLYGYETEQDTPTLGDESIATVTAFTVSDSSRTDYRFPISVLTSNKPNVMWAITIQNIAEVAWIPEPQPDIWGPVWATNVPVLTPTTPYIGPTATITFRVWVKDPNNGVTFLDDTAIGTFPAPLFGFRPQIHWPVYG